MNKDGNKRKQSLLYHRFPVVCLFMCFVAILNCSYAVEINNSSEITQGLVVDNFEKLPNVFQNASGKNNNDSHHDIKEVSINNGTRWFHADFKPSINRQERVHSLRNTLQSASSKDRILLEKHVHHHLHSSWHDHDHDRDQHHHEHQKVNSERTPAETCGSVLMKKVKIVLVRALTTWVHMNLSSMPTCTDRSSITDDENKILLIENNTQQNQNWIEILASSILSVSRSDNTFGDSQCLARIAVNTVRLLLLDESLSSLLNCSTDGNNNRLSSAQIVELVTSSHRSVLPWRQQAVEDYGNNGDDFSTILLQMWRAQRRILNETAPGWSVEAAACFNSDDTGHHRHNYRHYKTSASEMFDSAAIDAVLFLSLGYVPDVKCPPTDVRSSVSDETQPENFIDEDVLVPEFFHANLKKMLHVDEATDHISFEDFEDLLASLGVGAIYPASHDNEHDHHSDDHDDHEHHDHSKRSTDEGIDERNATLNTCFTSDELLTIYGFNDSDAISYENLTAMFPALIHQQISGVCKGPPEAKTAKLQPTTLQRYGWGTVAVLVVSLGSMIFLVIIPSTHRQNYRYIMSALIALSTSTMLADALLHLLPQALSIHNHSRHSGTDLNAAIEVEDFVLKQLVALGAIYAFYLFEMLVSGRHHANMGNHGEGGHGHSHIPDFEQLSTSQKANHHQHHNHHRIRRKPCNHQSSSLVLETIKTSAKIEDANNNNSYYYNWGMSSSPEMFSPQGSPTTASNSSPSHSSSQIGVIKHEFCEQGADHSGGQHFDDAVSNNKSNNLWHITQLAESTRSLPVSPVNNKSMRVVNEDMAGRQYQANRKGGFFNSLRTIARECVPSKTLGWMVIMGDSLHNVIDGLAIGAAFSEDLVSGLSTSIAIAFHEIPHEVGDFAALLTAGLSWRAALLWDCFHTILAFGGLYLGLGISTEVATRQWVFALTAGMFIYVSLTEMLPELTRVTDNFWKYFAWQNLGLLFGFGLMLLIAVFEDKLAITIKLICGEKL